MYKDILIKLKQLVITIIQYNNNGENILKYLISNHIT